MEAMQWALIKLGHSASISINLVTPGLRPILFGAHHLEPSSFASLPSNTIIYNLEQLAEGYPWFIPPYIDLLRRFHVWDFSERNIEFLRRSGISPGARLVPVGYAPCLTRIPPAAQDIDVLFFGLQSPRRRKVLLALGEAGLNVVALTNVWGRERDAWIARAKVVLNMHNQDSGEFEVVRVLYLLANRKAVVCEVANPNEVPMDLQQGFIPSAYDDLVAACLSAVRHEGLRNIVAAAGFHAATRRERDYAVILKDVLDGRVQTSPGSGLQRSIQNIAVGTAGQIGDQLACEPVIRHIRRRFPTSKITFVADHRYIDITTNHPDIDEIVPVNGLSEWLTLANSGRFDMSIDLNLDGWGCRVTKRVYRKPSEWLPINGDNYYLFGPLLPVLCLAAGLPPLVDSPKLYIDHSHVTRIDALGLPRKFVVFHCQSSEVARNWSTNKWRQLAARIANELNLPIIEIGLEPTIESPNVSSHLCGALHLLDTAEVIRRASCFVGTDSAPAHMAVALSTPSVVIAGHFRQFKNYFPYTGKFAHSEELIYLLNAEGPASGISTDKAYTAVKAHFD